MCWLLAAFEGHLIGLWASEPKLARSFMNNPG
jgi:hypothetical protein